ncbi:hypothetical protein M6B38_316685 [Iris pallida]|uniref:Uncharacterized protein n=1 Tax=Iris pallida TaxID=29817 RepID=A0AAX6HDP3_IRIPA|nr:hypothetical protein M6B38_316685 [Iris pallida]
MLIWGFAYGINKPVTRDEVTFVNNVKGLEVITIKH